MTGPEADAVGRGPRWTEDLKEALAFLTPLTGSGSRPSARAMTFFPLAGAAIGLVEGALWRAVRRRWPALPAAAIVVAADAALTGALHLDGLADAADGLFAHAPVKDRLAIMTEPQVGTFGTLALVVAVVGRTGALGAMEPSPVLLAALSCSSRSLMALGSRVFPYARETGLATPFLPTGGEPDRTACAAIGGMAASVLAAALARGKRGALGVAAGSLAGFALLLQARRQLGGFTGDVLGAAGEVCEVVGLLVSARS